MIPYGGKRAHQKGVLNDEFVDEPIDHREKIVTRIDPMSHRYRPQINAIVSFPLK